MMQLETNISFQYWNKQHRLLSILLFCLLPLMLEVLSWEFWIFMDFCHNISHCPRRGVCFAGVPRAKYKYSTTNLRKVSQHACPFTMTDTLYYTKKTQMVTYNNTIRCPGVRRTKHTVAFSLQVLLIYFN